MRRLTERPSNTHTPMLYQVESTHPSLIQMSTDYLGIVSNKQHAGTIRNKDATTTSRGRSTQDKCSSPLPFSRPCADSTVPLYQRRNSKRNW